MANQNIGQLTGIAASAVNRAEDLLVVWDASAVGAAKTKSLNVAESRALVGVGVLHATFDGQGAVVSNNVSKLFPIEYAGNIAAVAITGDTTGNINVFLKRYTPSAGALGSATNLGNIVLSNTQQNRDTTLTNFTTAIAQGDVVEMLTSGTVVNVTRVTAIVRLI